MLFRAYCDDEPPPPGINVFDLHPYTAVDGKPADYRSERKGHFGQPRPIGSRFGPQNMVVCGWALQALKLHPGLWDEAVKLHAPDDLRVPVADPPPLAMWPLGQLVVHGVAVDLLSTRTHLTILVSAERAPIVLKVLSRPDAQGTSASVTVAEGGKVSVADGKGQALDFQSELIAADGNRVAVRLVLPYTAAKGQKAWANGIELGRYSIQVGGETRKFVLASSEEQVRAWLEQELARGLRTWQAISKEKGFIPTGIGTGQHWDGYSDTGGYAHLLSAAAQWLFLLDNRRDWDAHRVPAVLPTPARQEKGT